MTTPSPEHVEYVVNKIARTAIEPSDVISDNVAMFIADGFERHHDCPDEDDPGGERDDEQGNYMVWALEREKELIKRIATAAILSSQEWLEKNGADKEG